MMPRPEKGPSHGSAAVQRRDLVGSERCAVGGEPLGRIVAVWFIANSFFGRRPGEAYFANVRILDEDSSIEVFAPH